MNNVTHKITYLEMWIYFLFFNSEHSQVHMSGCYFIYIFQLCSQDLFGEFWKKIFLLKFRNQLHIHVYVFALQFKEKSILECVLLLSCKIYVAVSFSFP